MGFSEYLNKALQKGLVNFSETPAIFTHFYFSKGNIFMIAKSLQNISNRKLQEHKFELLFHEVVKMVGRYFLARMKTNPIRKCPHGVQQMYQKVVFK